MELKRIRVVRIRMHLTGLTKKSVSIRIMATPMFILLYFDMEIRSMEKALSSIDNALKNSPKKRKNGGLLLLFHALKFIQRWVIQSKRLMTCLKLFRPIQQTLVSIIKELNFITNKIIIHSQMLITKDDKS